MKNFFKKLAFVMALAMVITSLAPAAGVFAASAPKLNAKSATLLLGNKKRNTFDFNLANKVKGSTYKWTTSNKKVATVAQNGLVTAVANGTATIKLAIKLPTGKTTTLSATVTVKTNATSVEITNLPEGALKVGTKHNFNRSYTTLTGKKTTDVTKFVITSENADKATINANGFFTATEPGEYTIKAIMAQSNLKMSQGTYTAESKEVKVNVAGITSVTQVDVDTVKATFGAPVAKEDISVYNLVSGNKIAQLVKAVTLSEDKLTATIDLYLPLAGEKTYGVELKNVATKEFVAATSKVEDVDHIEIATSTAVAGKETEVKVKLFNKENIDITTSELLSNVTITSSALNSYYDDAARKITFYNVGDTAELTAVFHTYKYDNATGEEIGISKTVKTIVAVSADQTVAGAIDKSTVVLNDETFDDFKTVTQGVPVNEQGARLYVQLTETTGSKKETLNSSANPSYFTFESTDDSTLIVSPTGQLYPVKEGSAVVMVKYGKDSTVAKTNVGAVTVNVTAERKVVGVKVSADSVSLSNSPLLLDSKTVTVKAVDRFDKKFGDQTKLELALLGNYTAAKKAELEANLFTGLTVNADGDYEVTFKGVNVDKGTYQFKVSHGTIVRVITVTVSEPTGKTAADIKTYRLDLNTNKLDLKVDKDTTAKKVTVDLVGLASNGVAIAKVTPASGYAIEYVAPGTTTPVSVTNGAIDFLANGVKAKTGTYVVRAYKTLDNGGKVLVASQTIEVVDTQEKVVLAEVKNLTFKNKVVVDNTLIHEAFKFTLNGKDITELGDVTVTGIKYTGSVESGSIWIESVEVSRVIGSITIKDTVSINLVVRFN